jgi:ADP-ribosyl-[dinitrogen reductase] hydrolase
MTSTAARSDRACGVLLASATGDALGAPYEFGPPRGPDLPVDMDGGGSFGWEPGEWTDDTSMAIAIAEVAAAGADLRSEDAQDAIVARWCEWAATAKDIGSQTRAVLAAAEAAARREGSRIGARHARAAAERHHARVGRSGGNGSLMRTAPVALAFLDDEAALVEAATAISALTHFDPEAGEACALWCLAIRHAVQTGELDVRRGLSHLAADRREVWSSRIGDAEAKRPADFKHNGWVVEAFQGAWSAIKNTTIPADDPGTGVFAADHLRLALDAAVRGGRDTDTVAAIAGALLGGAYGSSAVPAAWRRALHGWPGQRARDLVAMATSIVGHGAPDTFDYSYSQWTPLDALVQHPYDCGVWIGGIAALHSPPPGVDAVVSLCRIGPDQVPANVELVEVRLIDRNGAGHNPHLRFVLDDTVTLIEQLRGESRTVLLHCVQAHSRTPAVAALYGARRRGVTVDTALADIRAVLPHADPNESFRDALRATETQ